MIYRARIVMPVSQPPIEDGAVVVSGNRITAVAPWSELKSRHAKEVKDLGDSILLPGLVNAHCHLDYTGMTGLLAPKQFPDWIKGLLALKSAASYTDYAEAWLTGAKMLLRTGTTTVADIEAVPELLPEVWSSTPLRVASFLELTCVKSKRVPEEILREAKTKMASLKPKRGFVGLSPHALYSTTPAFLQHVARRSGKTRLTMHVAESLAEFDMYAHRRGSLFDWLKSQRDMDDCGQGTPVKEIYQCGLLGENFLAVHANYLESGDIKLLAKTKSSVVHCPRSHAYFRHKTFPYKELAVAGVNVCLGTDSLASMTKMSRAPLELNMFTEMRHFGSHVPPDTILKMATMNGARALGLAGQIGELSPGAWADFITVPFHGKTKDAVAAVVNFKGRVTHSIIDGIANELA